MNTKKLSRQKSALSRFTILTKAEWYKARPIVEAQGFFLDEAIVCHAYDAYVSRKKEELSSLKAAVAGR